MRILIQNGRIAGTATDDYTGPNEHIAAPAGFDPARMEQYRVVNGALVIPTPTVVTMRQARLALLAAGRLTAVNTAIAAMTGAAGDAARIEWEFATTVQRDSPLIAALAGGLKLTPAQIDELFVAAARL